MFLHDATDEEDEEEGGASFLAAAKRPSKPTAPIQLEKQASTLDSVKLKNIGPGTVQRQKVFTM